MIRVAVVGLGKMGISHLAIVNAHPDVTVVAVCDPLGYMVDVLEKFFALRSIQWHVCLEDCCIARMNIQSSNRYLRGLGLERFCSIAITISPFEATFQQHAYFF